MLPAVVSYPPSDAAGPPPRDYLPSDAPPSPPLPTSPPAHPPARESRLRTAIRHPERSGALLALLIGFASVFSAVLAWRASLASIDSSRYESLAVQEAARRNQLERLAEGTVDQDERFVIIFQEHALAARELQAQADELRATDPTQADILDLEAQAQLALARATQPFFLGAGGIALGDDGTVAYDRDFVVTNLKEGDVELRELSTERNVANAARADARALNLIGVAAVVISALFFLTVAQVSRGRPRMQQAFFAAGALLVSVGGLGWLIVELFA
jgi:hypothetical protein